MCKLPSGEEVNTVPVADSMGIKVSPEGTISNHPLIVAKPSADGSAVLFLAESELRAPGTLPDEAGRGG